jgi:hypothetical protein
MFSFPPLQNPIGFGPFDFVALAAALVLAALALFWKPFIEPAGRWLAGRTALCMVVVGIAPVALRLALLSHHPAPLPDLYDEFGHLFVADTLRHWRLANPTHPFHRFFETFFILQEPTYSSIYPIGNGLLLLAGWAGVLMSTGLFCALVYWMLLGWLTPDWALAGGLIAVMEFGPLNQWTNSYWGGALSAAAGCLVFGALPRIEREGRVRDAVWLGIGLGLHLLTRPYESIYLVLAAASYFAIWRIRSWRLVAIAVLVTLPAIGVTLLQNKRVTGDWTTLPYRLSQYQYGVPAPLTVQDSLLPHRELTREQDLDYRMQREFHPGRDTVGSYFARLWFRTRYYRFFFYPPLYVALVAFLWRLREQRWQWVAGVCLLFAMGVNFFPAFQFHYVAAAVCLFVLMAMVGLQRLPGMAAAVILMLCAAQFAFWYGISVPAPAGFGAEARSWELWNALDGRNQARRREAADELAKKPGKLLIFVRYWPQHIFQEEWVWNGADIDAQRVVWARDLGDAENRKLMAYYPDRKALLFEPDGGPLAFDQYLPEEPLPELPPEPESKEKKSEPKKPVLRLEQVM